MYEGPVQDLIDELGRLPGIGPKSAQRLAFHLLAAEADEVERLVRALAPPFPGAFTFHEEFTSRIWATGYDFPAVRDGRRPVSSFGQGSDAP